MKANAPKRKVFNDAVDLLTGGEPAAAGKGVQMLPVDSIKPFHSHPFRLYEGERLDDMVESVREHGVLVPAIVRTAPGGYEMLAGHNRLNAARLAGLTEIPAIVKEGLPDAEAYVYVIETNMLQRSFNDLSVSERIAVLAERYDKVCGTKKREEILAELQALNGGGGHDVHQQAKSRELLGKELGLTGRHVARYALGALELFDGIYDIDSVRMAIYQPRRENVSVCVMGKDELLRWAEGELKEKARLAYAGEGEFCAGEHCRFCKAKAVCRKRAEYNLELAKYDFEMPATLEDDEIAAILVKADELAAWAADVKEFALQQALSGVKYAGFKVVAGRSNRKYTDEKAVADTVSKAGYDPYEPKLLGITAMEKLLGKKKFAEILKGLVEKPQGKPALVPESDKRPELNTAQEDFKED